MSAAINGILVGVVLAASCAMAQAQDEIDLTAAFADHGVAAAVSECRGAIAAADADGNPIILAMALDVYRGAARTSLIVIDAGTGDTRQYWHPDRDANSEANYCLMISSKGLFYTMLGDTFLEFDVHRREWTFAESAGPGTAMALAEGPDGTIYAGTYPQSLLWAFDPVTRDVKRVARLDAVEEYPFSMAVDEAGWLYAGIGTARANLVAVHLATGEVKPLVDESKRVTGSGRVLRATDGTIYGQAPGQSWLRLEGGKGVAVDSAPAAASIPCMSWGSLFRDFPNGGRLVAFDLPDKTFTVEDTNGTSRTQSFDYVSEGAGITTMIAGPGGVVYGSTCHPFRLFACDGRTGALRNLGGLRKVGGGNWCGMAARGDTVYGAAYCGGFFYALDTTKPWHDSEDAEANPRLLVQYAQELTRPRTALAHPDGRHLVFAGFPGYGYVGGGIAVYDAETGEATLIENKDLLPGQSTVTLAALSNGDLVGGTSIDAPGGAKAVAESGRLFVMDWASRKIAFDIEPVAGAREVNCLETAPDGRVYGITNTAQFFVFDPASKAVVGVADVSEHGGPLRPDQSILRTPEGRTFMVLSRTVLEVIGEGVTPRAVLPEAATAGLGYFDGRLYYAVGARVSSYRIRE
ncbi:MAG TPA: hypothetical protein PLO37_07815 [Candidatus Hydrogenedentes bacterium]|nr:hypothetical protein [Candidatus Hydrogenedentota bacterium]HPG66737.1 hypothetical protein [Candidatus Hydrogenedentota bacterium]